MRFAAIVAALFVTSTAYADRDPAFEEGLVEVAVQGDQVMPGPQYARPQLVYKDTTTAKTIGTIAAVGGGLSLVAGWTLYAVRQNFRLEPRFTVTPDVVSSWETLGAWSMSLTGFGAANIVYSEFALLPESRSITTLAWIGGVAGVGVAAVGVGFLAGGSACSPVAYQPGAEVPLSCLSGTADRLFGWQLLMSSAVLLNLPLVYALRNAFRSTDSLTLGPGGIEYTARF